MQDEASLAKMLEQGRHLQQQGRLESARQVYQEILQLQPTHFDVLNLMGVLAGQSRDLEEAVRYFDRAIAVAPSNPAPYCNRGLALKELRHLDAALSSFDRAIELKNDDAVSYYCRGNIYKETGRADLALADFDKSLALNPGFAHAHFNRGTVLQQLHMLDAALASYDRAVEIKSDFAEAYINRGFVLHMQSSLDAAIASYERALELRPDHVAYLYLGNALKDRNQREEALRCYGVAIEIKPDYAEAFANRGVVFHDLNRIDEALTSYEKAIALKPEYAEAYFNRGSLLRSVQRFEAAIADFRAASAFQGDIKFLPGALLEAQLQICDWNGIDSAIAQVIDGIERDEPTAHPFALLTFCGDPRLQRRAAEIFVREACAPDGALGSIAKRAKTKKLRIGYFSADFREHPVSRLMAELIEIHDRARFEVFAFSFGPDTQDPMRKRLEAAFDEFFDVRGKSDRDSALLARGMDIDIAVDLGGYTGNSRTGIFALRAAPIQINYLGYPGTMGSTYMDYLVADKTLISDEDQQYYSEKIIFLPTFQANDSKRRISERVFTRDELKLPPMGFVYCCFNTSYKIMPQTFGCWMRILHRVPNSVLLLDAKTDSIVSNLRKEARERGIEASRLVFGTPLSFPDWLARHRVADLFLDTLPYNAGTTASDALWAGLPVLTCTGASFTGRMASSLLRSIGLPELVASTPKQYEDLAVELALEPGRLADLKRRLAQNRATTSLFDQRLFAKHLESAYTIVYERNLADLPPEYVHVM